MSLARLLAGQQIQHRAMACEFRQTPPRRQAFFCHASTSSLKRVFSPMSYRDRSCEELTSACDTFGKLRCEPRYSLTLPSLLLCFDIENFLRMTRSNGVQGARPPGV